MIGTYLIITTSREPSRRSRSFIKDLARVIPNSLKLNRGKATYEDLARIAINKNAYGVLMTLEMKGNPSALSFWSLNRDSNTLVKRILIQIKSVKLLREIPSSQQPLNIKFLRVSSPNVGSGLPYETLNALIEILKPKITADLEENTVNSVDLIVGGDSKEASVLFLCSSTGRPCGPQFKVVKVVRYGT